MPKIDAIAAEAARHLVTLMRESSEDIEAALVSTAAEAQASDVEAKLTITFAMIVSLDRNAVTHRLSFSTRHKVESVAQIEDQNQPALPIE